MKANPILVAAALIYGAGGVLLLFAPQELWRVFSTGSDAATIPLQLLGAAVLALASLNWNSRYAVVGGIYGRPLTGTNFIHAMLGALVLAARLRRSLSWPVVVGVGGYLILAGAFYFLMRRRLPVPAA